MLWLFDFSDKNASSHRDRKGHCILRRSIPFSDNSIISPMGKIVLWITLSFLFNHRQSKVMKNWRKCLNHEECEHEFWIFRFEFFELIFTGFVYRTDACQTVHNPIAIVPYYRLHTCQSVPGRHGWTVGICSGPSSATSASIWPWRKPRRPEWDGCRLKVRWIYIMKSIDRLLSIFRLKRIALDINWCVIIVF